MNPTIISIMNNHTVYIINVESKIQTLLSFYLPSSELLKSSDDIRKYRYLITDDKKIVESSQKQNLFKPIKKFDKTYLLMKLSK